MVYKDDIPRRKITYGNLAEIIESLETVGLRLVGHRDRDNYNVQGIKNNVGKQTIMDS
jgi:hypothetical protein